MQTIILIRILTRKVNAELLLEGEKSVIGVCDAGVDFADIQTGIGLELHYGEQVDVMADWWEREIVGWASLMMTFDLREGVSDTCEAQISFVRHGSVVHLLVTSTLAWCLMGTDFRLRQ